PSSPLLPYTTLFRSPGFLVLAAAIAVGMAFHREAAIGGLDRLVVGAPIDLEQLVIIGFNHDGATLPPPPPSPPRKRGPSFSCSTDRKSTRLNSRHVK